MNFIDVKLLTYDHKNNFWGDKSFRYGSTVSMSINGYILNLANTYGVKDIFQACKTLSDSLQKNQDIIINNINYGVGKITGVSFNSGNWVKATEYTATIEIIDKGSLDTFPYSSENDFSNSLIQSIKSNIEYVEDFTESYSIDYSSNEDSINGQHSIDLKISSLFQGSKIEFAQNLAKLLYSKTTADKLSKIQYSKPDESLRKDYYSENYDSISGACGFKRNFSYSNKNSCFSEKRSISLSIGEDGITTVNESNTVKGECLSPTLFESAQTGFTSLINSSFSRCLDVFNIYKTSYGIVNTLISDEIERSVKRNKFTGEIEYNITFTNDKRRKGLYSYEYTLDLSRSEDFIWNAVENGSIKGKGTIGSDEKFNNAINGWIYESSGIQSRVLSFYSSNAKIKPSSPILKLINKNLTYQPFDGVVSYSWSFTDDSTLDMNAEIRRKSIEINDSKPVRIHNDFLIPGNQVSHSIAQAAKQSKQGEREIAGSLEISSQIIPFVGNKYFTDCVNLANSNKGSGNDTYLESFSFSTDEIEQNITFNAKYKYSESATNN